MNLYPRNCCPFVRAAPIELARFFFLLFYFFSLKFLVCFHIILFTHYKMLKNVQKHFMQHVKFFNIGHWSTYHINHRSYHILLLKTASCLIKKTKKHEFYLWYAFHCTFAQLLPICNCNPQKHLGGYNYKPTFRDSSSHYVSLFPYIILLSHWILDQK